MTVAAGRGSYWQGQGNGIARPPQFMNGAVAAGPRVGPSTFAMLGQGLALRPGGEGGGGGTVGLGLGGGGASLSKAGPVMISSGAPAVQGVPFGGSSVSSGSLPGGMRLQPQGVVVTQAQRGP